MNTRIAARLGAALALLLATLGTVPASAGEAEIRQNIGSRLPPDRKIEEIRKTPVPGLYEVRVNAMDLFYTDEQGNYLIQGQVIDLKARRNLTEERLQKLSEIDFDKLPLKDAFTVVRGNGKRKLAVFEDPNCSYCKHFEQELTQVKDVTVYLFLYPVLGPDSVTKANHIWCAKDRAKSWSDWMQRSITPTAASCDTAAITRNREFGQRYAINGTPTLIFANGTRMPGAMSADEVQKQLAAAP